MTYEEAEIVLKKKVDYIKENWEKENTFDYYWTSEDVDAIETVLKALMIVKADYAKEDSIPKEKVRERITELKDLYKKLYHPQAYIVYQARIDECNYWLKEE